jgi:hypothetical protein
LPHATTLLERWQALIQEIMDSSSNGALSLQNLLLYFWITDITWRFITGFDVGKEVLIFCSTRFGIEEHTL